MRKLFLFLFALSAGAPTTYALDKNDEEALNATQALLRDQAAVNAFAKDNEDAQGALKKVDKLTGGNKAQKAEINSISSDIFADMVKANNGDSSAVQDQLQRALKDPQAFMNSLSPEQRARIRGLASEIDKQNATNNAPETTTTK